MVAEDACGNGQACQGIGQISCVAIPAKTRTPFLEAYDCLNLLAAFHVALVTYLALGAFPTLE